MFVREETLHPLLWERIDDRLKRYTRLLPPKMRRLFRSCAAMFLDPYLEADDKAWLCALLGATAANALLDERRIRRRALSDRSKAANEFPRRRTRRERELGQGTADEIYDALDEARRWEKPFRWESFSEELMARVIIRSPNVTSQFPPISRYSPDGSQALSHHLDLTYAAFFASVITSFEDDEEVIEADEDYIPALSAFRRAVRKLSGGDAGRIKIYFYDQIEMDDVAAQMGETPLGEQAKLVGAIERLGLALEREASCTTPRMSKPGQPMSKAERAGIDRLLRAVLRVPKEEEDEG